jgi:hypothetical protein
MFGVLVAALFFGKPEIILLVGVGSAIPDLDREYAFFSRSSFRDHQIHRALCHNYLFLGLLYLVNPFVALGAFLHTLLDALTTAKDRGVEWLYPFSRFVKKAANDERGKPLETKPGEIYLYQYDPIEFTRMSDRDLKERKPAPWRRTYGPALSGGLLDLGIFIASLFLFVLFSIVSAVLQGMFVGLSLSSYHFSTMFPLFLAIAGIATNMLVGELDRRKRRADDAKPSRAHNLTFAASLILMISAIVAGAYLNQQYVVVALGVRLFPYILVGTVIVIISALVAPKIYPRVAALREHNSEDDEEKIEQKKKQGSSSKVELLIV